MVALVFNLLDLVGLVPDRRVLRKHFLEQPGAHAELLSQRAELGVEIFVSGNEAESKGQGVSFESPANLIGGRG